MSEPTLEQRMAMQSSFQNFLHTASWAFLIGAPVLIALPPRKLDLYTFFLAGSFVAAGNHLVKERTGAGLLYQLPGARPPAAVLEYQERLRAQQVSGGNGGRSMLAEHRNIAAEQAKAQEAKTAVKHRDAEGLEAKAKDLWMGGETEGWKERRLREEQEKLDQGEGYGGMIVDQIWEVWNWDKTKKGQDQKEDLKAAVFDDPKATRDVARRVQEEEGQIKNEESKT